MPLLIDEWNNSIKDYRAHECICLFIPSSGESRN